MAATCHQPKRFAALALLLLAGRAKANAVVTIDYAATLIFGDRGPDGIRFTRVFDELYSAFFHVNFVKDDATALSPKKSKPSTRRLPTWRAPIISSKSALAAGRRSRFRR